MDSYLTKCRYYKGEQKCPFKDEFALHLWEYEKMWVYDCVHNLGLVDVYVNWYEHDGMLNFSFDDGVPVSLKAVLYNRYMHWNRDGGDGFKKWYQEYYLSMKHHEE